MLPTNIDERMDRFPPIGSDVPPKRIKYSKRKAIASRLRAFIRSLSCMWACHHLLSPPSETPRILLTSTGNIPFGFQSGLLDFSLVPDIFTSMSLFSAFSFRTVLRCVSSGAHFEWESGHYLHHLWWRHTYKNSSLATLVILRKICCLGRGFCRVGYPFRISPPLSSTVLLVTSARNFLANSGGELYAPLQQRTGTFTRCWDKVALRSEN